MSVEERGLTLPRVGLVCNDEIRIAGVEAALSGVDGAEVVRLSHPGMVESLRLEVVLIDSSSTTPSPGVADSLPSHASGSSSHRARRFFRNKVR